MGLIRAIFRFIFTLGGLLEGTTQRATDALLTASPDTIRSQFRKSREDAIKNYNEMKDAVAELSKLHQEKSDQVDKLNTEAAQLAAKMNGAKALFKQSKDLALREAYARFAAEREKTVKEAEALVEELVNQEQLIENYKSRLMLLQKEIEDLKEEEADTIAVIVSSRKISELNAKLQGLSTDTQTKNLDAIREARGKLKATAKLTTELSGQDKLAQEDELLSAGLASSYLAEFDKEVQVDTLFNVEPEQLEAPQEARKPVVSVQQSDPLDTLFKD
jgi:phage shock protein A